MKLNIEKDLRYQMLYFRFESEPGKWGVGGGKQKYWKMLRVERSG